MQVIETAIPDVKVLVPKQFKDHRGFFSEVYNSRALKELGILPDFVQDNHSLSAEAGVVRGLHFQLPPMAQDKLLRVVRGAILDVAVDIRPGSPTFGKWVGEILSGENFRQLWESDVYRTITIRTVAIAAAVTVTDVVLAFPIAFYMAKVASPRVRSILVVMVLVAGTFCVTFAALATRTDTALWFAAPAVALLIAFGTGLAYAAQVVVRRRAGCRLEILARPAPSSFSYDRANSTSGIGYGIN